MDQYYFAPTKQSVANLQARGIDGPVFMLNLLRFRDTADYSKYPDLAPDTPISGFKAYRRYLAHSAPFAEKSEGNIEFLGEGGSFLIGPEHERWDQVLLVKYKAVSLFLEFISDPGYLVGTGHREAALEDSRLLPITQVMQKD